MRTGRNTASLVLPLFLLVGGFVARPAGDPLALWSFEPDAPLASASGAMTLTAPDAPEIVPGVHGAAVWLEGVHAIQVDEPGMPELPEGITVSAWVLPTDLSGYREILRQECDRRVLFSFQHGGGILALGLNIGGYMECDAPVDPAAVLDGNWHHCAATFDGETMRVYLDGSEIGSLARPGMIATDPDAPVFVGSSSGTSEHFQGGLDEVRLYDRPLPATEISRLYGDGLASLDTRAEEALLALEGLYEPAGSLPETLAQVRRNLDDAGADLPPDAAWAVARSLADEFPDDVALLRRTTGRSPIDYLLEGGGERLMADAERAAGLRLEYAPLTDDQWAALDPDEAAEWREALKLGDRLAALQDDASAHDPGWTELILECGPGIDFRPSVAEAVAPYVEPTTPETRDLTSTEARDALERDWLHQAGGDPSPERILKEIGWTYRMIERLESSHGELSFRAERESLAELAALAADLDAPDAGLYFRVREMKRDVMLSNPVIDFDSVLFVDMPYPQGSEWPHETRHRLGYMAVPGARLLVLEGLGPDGHLRQLMPQEPLHGSFWRPDLSWDGQRVLFCFKPHNEKSFHIYEMSVDGGPPRQITHGPYDDLDPIYLPDGEHILFSTTRANTYVRCMPPTNAYILARCDLSGDDIYLVSRNNEPDYLPSVMDDGRVLYTRWEYTDKPLWRAQGLWTMRPDGTQVSVLWGNQSVWPDLLKDARSVPGSSRIMFKGSAHHGWFSGSVGLLDPRLGLNFTKGLTKVTADVEWPESGNGPVDPVESESYHASGHYEGYYSPYPLSGRDFLVSANRGDRFVLYLMDVDGNRELIHEGAHNILHALPVRPRPRPPVLRDLVDWPTRESRDNPSPGLLYSDNVYEGMPPEVQGMAAYLRVLNIQPKTYTYWHKRPYASTGPVVSMVQSEGVKRVLGTVPIEADGSFAFEAPPGMALHFQILDDDYRALQTMRSFTGVMPGEERGCLGCHEMHSRTPSYSGASLALQREPSVIEPLPWEDDTVSYDRYVQPVLDRYCGDCHQGEGEARDVLDLTRRPGPGVFDEPYVTLLGAPSWGQAYAPPTDPPPGFGLAGVLMVEGYDQRDPAAYQTPAPMTTLSYRSPLIELASSGEHHGVRVDDESLRRLILWVDTMGPYRGEDEVRAMPDPDFQGIDWLAIRPRIATAPRIARPGPVD
ncbi:MAG: hypothetical protein GF320_10660 [Armatimonadia bacterium]|nr:hypothetical protein [Armatimonadia bacterium]